MLPRGSGPRVREDRHEHQVSPGCFIGGLRASGPVARGAAKEQGARSELPTAPPAARHEGNVLVFAYTSLCLSTGGGQ